MSGDLRRGVRCLSTGSQRPIELDTAVRVALCSVALGHNNFCESLRRDTRA